MLITAEEWRQAFEHEPSCHHSPCVERQQLVADLEERMAAEDGE